MSRLFEALQRSEAERSGSPLPQMPSAATELLQAAEAGEARRCADFSSREFSSPDLPPKSDHGRKCLHAAVPAREHAGRAAQPAVLSDFRRAAGFDYAAGWAGSGEVPTAWRALAQHAGEPNFETNSGNQHYPRGRQERGFRQSGAGSGARAVEQRRCW